MPTGSKDFTGSVNLTATTVVLWPIKLLDVGVIIRGFGMVSNGIITIYTVPSGKAFYLFHYMVNVRHYATGIHAGGIHLYDGATAYDLSYLIGPDTVDQMSDSGQFVLVKIPEGWSIRVWAGTYAETRGMIVGVEVPA